MTQIDIAMAQVGNRQLLSERGMATLLAGSIVILQSAWFGALGYGVWWLF